MTTEVASFTKEDFGYVCRECSTLVEGPDIEKHAKAKHKSGMVRVFTSKEAFETWKTLPVL